MSRRVQLWAIAGIVLLVIAAGYFIANGLMKRVARISETPACLSEHPTTNLTVTIAEDIPVGENSLVLPFAKCMRPGMRIPVAELHLNAGQQRPSWWATLSNGPLVLEVGVQERGEVEVTKIFSLERNDLKRQNADLAKSLGVTNEDLIAGIKHTIQSLNLVMPVALAQVRMTKRPQYRRDRKGLTLLHESFVPVYFDNWNETSAVSLRLSAITNSGGVVIDVRSVAEFAADHLQGAVNVPYIEKQPTDLGNFLSYLPARGSDVFDVSQLPKDKATLLVFIGSGQHDTRVTKARLMAKLSGYQRTTVLWGGERARKNSPFETPAVPRFVLVINPLTALKKVNSGAALLIDARTPAEVAIRSIQNSRHLPQGMGSGQWLTDLTLDRELSQIELEEQLKWSPLEAFVKEKNRDLIFYGADAFDWRPLNLTRLALLAGYTRVYWMREGLAGWLEQAANDSQTFATKGLSSGDELFESRDPKSGSRTN